MQHVELLTGITAAPASGWARSVKDAANSFCWRLAARPALAAYADIQLKMGAGNQGMDNVNLVRKVSAADSKAHPQDDVLLTIYASSTVIAGADKYLEYRGLSWPRTGMDIDDINALLEYCRAFVHYEGDVTTDPMPLAYVEPIPFFTKAVDVGLPQAVHHEGTH
ncbi:MAG TPA: hypothetical protein VFG44_07010 [Burkholderiales bacterium]|nr:hypothetical protein [Burkholderiales bacterium]